MSFPLVNFKTMGALLLFTFCSVSYAQGDLSFSYYEDGELVQAATSTSPSYPVQFGPLVSRCLGNISRCTRGLTVAFWFKALRAKQSTDGGEVLVVSNGGHSHHSQGLYVRRRHGDQYTFGASEAANQWQTTLRLRSWAWLRVTSTWDPGAGLAVEIDGFPAGSDPSPRRRQYLPLGSDLFDRLVIGLSPESPGSDGLHFEVRNLTVHSGVQNTSQVIPGRDEDYFLGCKNLVLEDDNLTVTLGPAEAVSRCRRVCFDRNESLALVQDSGLCRCLSRRLMANLSERNACDSTGGWNVYVVWHVVRRKNYPLRIQTQILSGKPYAKPKDAVGIQINPGSWKPMFYSVDFADGTRYNATSDSLSHEWGAAGTFAVSVRAKIGEVVLTGSTTVTVEDVREGEAPQFLDIHGEHGALSKSGYFTLTAFATELTTWCTFRYGDGSPAIYINQTGFLQREGAAVNFSEIGEYETAFQCRNDFGGKTTRSTFWARSFERKTTPFESGRDFPIPVRGSDSSLKGLDVKLDGERAPFLTRAGEVVVSGGSLSKSAQKCLTVGASNSVLLTAGVLDLQSKLSDPSVSVDKLSGPRNSRVNFTATIPAGDHVFASISPGGAGTEQFYFDRLLEPFSIHRMVAFPDLGYFSCGAEIANDLGRKEARRLISIEIPIEEFRISITNASSLAEPVQVFAVANEPGNQPLKLKLKVDFGNNFSQAYYFTSERSVAHGAIKLEYTYPSWGVYRISINASNELGWMGRSAVGQAGQNISSVDVMTSDERVGVNDSVTLNVTCPTGSAVTYIVTFGDGEALTIPATTESPPDPAYSQVDSGTYQVKHRYTTPGHYTVNVSAFNVFGTATATLCPGVTVRDGPDGGLCEEPGIDFRDIDADRTMERMRSEEARVRVDTRANCDASVRFSWKASRISTADGRTVETSVPRVCVFRETNSTLVIPPLTLSFGLYKIALTAAPDGFDLLYSQKVLYLKIVPSPPLAIITGGSDVWFLAYATATFNLSESRDPDLRENARLGLSYHLFCLPYQSSEKTRKWSLDMMRGNSTYFYNHTLYAGFTNNMLSIYHYDDCFRTLPVPSIHFGRIGFPAAHLRNDTSEFSFRLFVTKENRMSVTEQKVQIRTSNSTSSLGFLDDLLNMGDNSAALNLIGKLSTEVDEEVKEKLFSAVDQISSKVENIDQVSQTAFTLFMLTNSTETVREGNRKTASSAITNLAKATKKFQTEKLDKITEVTTGVLGTVSNLLPSSEDEEDVLPDASSAKRRRKRREATDENPSAAEKLRKLATDYDFLVPPPVRELYRLLNAVHKNDISPVLSQFVYNVSYTDPGDIEELLLGAYRQATEEARRQKRETDRNVTISSVSALDDLTGVIVRKQDHNSTVALGSPTLAVRLQKFSTNGAGVQSMATTTGSFEAPASTLSSAVGGSSVLSAKFLSSSRNPFTWSNTSSKVRSGVLFLSYVDDTGKAISLKNTKEPFKLWINGNLDRYSERMYELVGGNNGMNIHPINITENGTALHVVVRPHRRTDRFRVSVRYDGPPTAGDSDHIDTVPRPGLRGQQLPERETDDLRYTVTPAAAVTDRTGTYRVGVQLHGGHVTRSKTTYHNYSLGLFLSTCKFWNERTDSWNSGGCEVGNLTTKYRTQCLCNHLTSFGSNVVVPPNTIDFNTVWSKFRNLGDNAAVFATVVSILVIYLALVIWARRMDKRDLFKWGATSLEDNLPSDTHHYLVSIYTGMRKDAGTESNISCILSGDACDSGVRKLSDGRRKHFAQGSIVNFILSVERPLGDLNFLRIWHDNSARGKRKSWFLNQIQVTDLQTKERTFFLCNRWLAVEEDDGMVDRVIPVAGMDDLVNFGHLFSSSFRKKLTNEHLWFSVFSRPTRSSFTRVQRISCCLSLLFMTMIVNCMWFRTEENVRAASTLQLGPFKFTVQQLFVSFASTMIVFPVNFLLVAVFRKARPRQRLCPTAPDQPEKGRWETTGLAPPADDRSGLAKFKDGVRKIFSAGKDADTRRKYEKQQKRKRDSSLPWWFTYLAWVLCFFSVSTSGFFTILYSMEWGKEKSLEWLTAFLLSFFQSVIVVQPIKVCLIVAFIACILKKPDVDQEVGSSDLRTILSPDEDLAARHERNATEILLQRKMASTALKPPDGVELKKAREQRLREIEIEELLREILVYTFFVLVLFFLSYQTRASASYLVGHNLRTMFLAAKGKSSFEKISRVSDYWVWLETIFLPTLYATHSLNGSQLKWWDKRCTMDMESRRVGVARLRQMRVKENSCTIEEVMANIINHCRDDYNWRDDDVDPYLPKWTLPSTENLTSLRESQSPWVYQDGVKLKNVPYVGNIETYKGGGYVANFKRSLDQTRQDVRLLKNAGWLDVQTRAVFLEFTVYNPNVNLFTSAILLTEFLSCGSAVTRAEFKVYRLFDFMGSFGVIVVAFQIIYSIFTVFFLVQSVSKIRRQKLMYFSQIWNLLEFTMVILSVVLIVLYIFKQVLGSLAITSLRESGSGDFVNFLSLALYDEISAYTTGVVVFLATIQFLKLLRFNTKMTMFSDTVRLAGKELKVFSVAFLLYFLAFTQLAFLLFGKTLSSYSGIITSLETMFAFVLGSFDFDALQGAQRLLGPIFFFSFIAIVYVVLMAVFLTILNDAFSRVKDIIEGHANDYNILEYAWQKFKAVIGVV